MLVGSFVSDARRGSAVWRLYVLFALVIPLALFIAVLNSGPPRKVLVIYGDSLTVQSESAAHQVVGAPDFRVVFRARGGTALCDWVKQAAEDAVFLQPKRVVIAFTGNTATCVKATYVRYGAAAAVALYEKSLKRLRAIYPAVPITIVIPPAVHDRVGWYPLNGDRRLVAMYERVGAQLHMYINKDADNWLTPGHVFAQLRPDLATGKMVNVRLSDGIHLTPAGARWYAAALLEMRTGDVVRSRTPVHVASG